MQLQTLSCPEGCVHQEFWEGGTPRRFTADEKAGGSPSAQSIPSA